MVEPATTPQCILTVDLESLFHGHPMYEHLTPARRREADNENTLRNAQFLLDLFNDTGTTATWFVVGEIADWYPDLITLIKDQGHEIGYHTFDHTILAQKNQLLNQLDQGADFITHYKPRGFRAPFYQLSSDCLPVLKTSRFIYDSSVYAHSKPQKLDGLWEIPIAYLPFRNSLANENISFPSGLSLMRAVKGVPLGSGLILSSPTIFLKKCIQQSLKNGIKPVLTLHPWQIDRPRYPWFLSRSFLLKKPWWIPYSRSVKNNVIFLLREFSFQSIEKVYKKIFDE